MEMGNQSANNNNSVEVAPEGVFIDLQVKIIAMILKSNQNSKKQLFYTKLKAVGIIIFMMFIVIMGILLIFLTKDMGILEKLEIIIKWI